MQDYNKTLLEQMKAIRQMPDGPAKRRELAILTCKFKLGEKYLCHPANQVNKKEAA